MKFVKDLIQNTLTVLAVLSLVFGVLSSLGVFEPVDFQDAIFVFLLMAFGTTLFVAGRELLLPEDRLLYKALDIGGCVAIVYGIAFALGWASFSWLYVLVLLGVVTVVYGFSWLLTWLQSKSAEEKLNALLTLEKDNEKNA